LSHGGVSARLTSPDLRAATDSRGTVNHKVLPHQLDAARLAADSNARLVCSEFVGIGAAAELLGMSRLAAVPIAAAVLWYLVVFGS
jgi:hypothetical protein